MRFGICGGEEDFAAIREAGADYVEPPVAAFADPEGPESAWRERLLKLRDAGLPAEAWNCFLPGDLRFIGPDADRERFERYVEEAVARLHEAGARILVFGSGAARSAPDGYDPVRALVEFSDAVVFVASMARSAEITVAIESLPERETNVVNDLLTAGIVSKAVMQPNVASCADLWHMCVEQDGLRSLEAVGETVRHAHLADTGRRAPGTGSLDIPGFFQALAAAGYNARVSIEARWDDLGTEAPPAIRFLRDQWAGAMEVNA
jgi:sugar phosphate isomerase/epimerase